jgi:hypothetical protein
MPKNNGKLKIVPPITPKSVDDELAEHLRQAEHHLIGAITLFSGPRRPNREGGYLKRLTGAQETITWLYRQELIRIRGPLKPKRGKK